MINPILTMVGSTVITIMVLVVLFFISAKVTISAFLGISLIYYFIIKLTRFKTNKNSETIALQDIKLTKTIQEGLGGIRDVILGRLQNFYSNIYDQAFTPYKKSSASNAFISRSPRYIIETLGIVLIATLAYILTDQSNLSEDSNIASSAIPILGTLALGAQRLLPLVQQIFSSYNSIRSHRSSIIDAIELLKQPIPKNYSLNKIESIEFKKHIRLKDVSYKYFDTAPWIFQNINIEIPKGSKVGFIGKTGSGKSTFLDITMGLIDPTKDV